MLLLSIGTYLSPHSVADFLVLVHGTVLWELPSVEIVLYLRYMGLDIGAAVIIGSGL